MYSKKIYFLVQTIALNFLNFGPFESEAVIFSPSEFSILVTRVINRLIVGSLSDHFIFEIFEGAFLCKFGHFLSSTVFLDDYFVEVALKQNFYVGVYWVPRMHQKQVQDI